MLSIIILKLSTFLRKSTNPLVDKNYIEQNRKQISIVTTSLLPWTIFWIGLSSLWIVSTRGMAHQNRTWWIALFFVVNKNRVLVRKCLFCGFLKQFPSGWTISKCDCLEQTSLRADCPSPRFASNCRRQYGLGLGLSWNLNLVLNLRRHWNLPTPVQRYRRIRCHSHPLLGFNPRHHRSISLHVRPGIGLFPRWDLQYTSFVVHFVLLSKTDVYRFVNARAEFDMYERLERP